MFSAEESVLRVRQAVKGLPVSIAGSAVAAARYPGREFSFHDVDVWAPTPGALFATVSTLRNAGWELKPRFERVYERWLQYGMKNWHTNSIELEHPTEEIEVNVIHKIVGGNPLTSLAQVVESFDFGLLAIGGWDCEEDTYRDLRGYFFPSDNEEDVVAGRLPMLQHRRKDWVRGFISQYQGLRQAGRYVKYVDYGYDMSLVAPDLVEGYWQAARYLEDKDDPAKKKLGQIYEAFARNIADNELQQLRDASKVMVWQDSLDAIMESLV